MTYVIAGLGHDVLPDARPSGNGAQCMPRTRTSNRYGILMRGSVVAGFWYVAGIGDGQSLVRALRQDEDGLRAVEVLLPSQNDLASTAEAALDEVAPGRQATHLFGRIIVDLTHAKRFAASANKLQEYVSAGIEFPESMLAVLTPSALYLGAQPYLSTLDQGALAYVSSFSHSHMTEGMAQAYVGLDSVLNPDDSLRECLIRKPGFAELWLRTWDSSPETFRGIEGSGAVASRLDTLLAEAGIPRWTREAMPDLERVRTRSGGLRENATNLDARLSLLSRLPASWLPKDDEAWQAFWDAWNILEDQGEYPEKEHLAGFLDVRGRWSAWLEKLSSISDGEPVGATWDTADMTKAFAAQVVAPVLKRLHVADEDEKTSMRMAEILLFSGRTLRNKIERSLAWHTHEAGIANRLARLRGDDWTSARWKAGYPDAKEGNLTIQVLTHEQELTDEGADGPDANGIDGLSHCVGGYASACVKEGVRIVSIRKAGKAGTVRVSTAELEFDGMRVNVTQHRGLENGQPDPKARAMLDRYVAGLNEGSLKFDKDALQEDMDYVAPDPAGYPSDVDANLRIALEAWAPHMTRRLRELDVEEFVETVRAVLEDVPSAWWVPELRLPDIAALQSPCGMP